MVIRWKVLSLLSIVIGAFVLVASLVMIATSWTPFPVEDQWEQLVSGRAITWSWLISQQNEHRLFFPRLTYIADRWLFAERNLFGVVSNVALQLSLAFIIFKLAVGSGLDKPWQKSWAAGLILSLLFWSGQYAILPYAMGVSNFGVVLAAAGAF